MNPRKHKKTRRDWLLTVLTVVVTALAITVGGYRATQLLFGEPDSVKAIEVADWETFATGGHRVGPGRAAVTVVVFYDFLCPFCQDAAFALQSLRHRYPNDLAVVYRHAPPSSILSLRLAVGAECAARSGYFLPFHDAIMAEPEAMRTENRQMWAERSGVTDTASFFFCLDDPAGNVGIHRDTLAARQLGITGTPTFLINDRLIDGYPGFDELHQLSRDALTDERARSHIEKSDHELSWRYDKLWELSTAKNEFLAETVLPDWAIASDSSDNVYVRDLTTMTIHVISEHGELVASLGREGEGPGEFCNPESIDVSTDGTLTVMDKCAPGFLRWNARSRRFDEWVRTESTLAFGGRMRELSKDSIIVTERERYDDPDGVVHYTRHVSIWTPEVTKQLRYGSPSPRRQFASPCGYQQFLYPMFFEPTVAWDERDGVLAIASDSAYVIDVFVDGKPTARIHRDVEVRETSAEMVGRHLEAIATWERALGRWEACGMPRTEAIRRIGYAPYLQPIADVRVAPGGKIWVRRGHAANETGGIDIFTLTGDYLGTLPDGSLFPAAFLSLDRILVAGQDEFGATLTAFRVWGQDAR